MILVGNLGRDPEVRATANSKLANITIATSDRWNNKQTGQREEKTEWHKLVAFGTTAEVIEKYLRKGSKVYVEGKLTTRKWQDKDGQERYTTEIVVDALTMLDSKSDGEAREPVASAPKKLSDDLPFYDEVPF